MSLSAYKSNMSQNSHPTLHPEVESEIAVSGTQPSDRIQQERNVRHAYLEDITEKQRPGGELPSTTVTSALNRAKEDNDQFRENALLVIRKVDKDGKSLSTELEIHSSIIQDALRSILNSYAFVNLSANPITIKQPYAPLFHYRKEILRYTNAPERSVEEREYMSLLTDEFITPFLSRVIKRYEEEIAKGRVSFDLLWTLFRADDDTIVRTDHYEELQRVFHCEEKGDTTEEKQFFVCTWRWGYNEGKFGPCSETVVIPSFSSSRRIEHLPCFPVKVLRQEDQQKLYKKMITRGHQWKELVNKPTHRKYNGPTWTGPLDTTSAPPQALSALEILYTKGRIMLDHELHVQYAPKLADQLIGADGYTVNNQEGYKKLRDPSIPAVRIGSGGYIKPDYGASTGTKIIFNDVPCYKDDEEYDMSDEQAYLCPARCRGFTLSEKRWALFLVDSVQTIEYEEGAFRSLEIGTDFKEVIQALVERHESSSKKFDDFLSGKGKGVVIMLEGPPGSGKTLTAESVAELTKKPLYSIGIGELSNRADHAERNLLAVFRRAAKWGAVLLLDEADLFLAKRTPTEMERNGYVTVFLRLLEYYHGIMFLTTNRVEEIDPAFDSRIHLSIRYKSPDVWTRAAIWKNFLHSHKAYQDWEPEVFVRLGNDLEAHGREIKNLIRMSLAIADYREQPLSEKIIREVYEIKRSGRI